MDVVVASLHSRFNLSEKEQTERVLKAFNNPYITIFGHPSGRLLNHREAYSIDMIKVIEAAASHGIALEIKSQPTRMDLFDYYCKIAKEKGAKFAIDTDSHYLKQISFLKLGVAVAKRGWLEKDDIINTWELDKLQRFLQARRSSITK